MKNNINRIVFRLRPHKRALTIIVSVSLALILVATSIILSQCIWGDYKTNYPKKFTLAKTQIDNEILKTSSASVAIRLKNIQQTQVKLTSDVKTYCGISPLVSWQQFIGQYADEIKSCNQQKTRLSNLLVSMGVVVSYLKAEQSLASIISIANTKTNQNNQADKWNKIEAFWRTAITDTSKLSSSDNFKLVKITAVSDFSRIADSWKSLSVANDAKNRQDYDTAKSNIATAYAALSSVSDANEVQYNKLIVTLNNNYAKSF